MRQTAGSRSTRASSPSASLKMLSETEKLQLMQLQKTRERIAKELKKYPGADNIDYDDDDIGFGATSKPNSGYGKSRRTMRVNLMSGSTSRPASRQDYFETIKQGLDMVPVMATSGSAAIGAGDSKGKIKLPIFKLPSIDTSKLESLHHNKNLERAIKQGEFAVQYVPYRDISSYRKALVLMIKALGKRDSELIQKHLRMTAADITDLENELKKKADTSALASTSKTPRRTPKTPGLTPGRSPLGREQSAFFPEPATTLTMPPGLDRKETVLDTLFREDPNMSVFLLAKDAVMLAKRDQLEKQAGDAKEAIQYNKALRNITSKMDMSALGLSDSMAQYLTQGTVAAQHVPAGTQGFEKLKTNVSAALGGFVTAGVTHHNAVVSESAAAEVALQQSPAVRKIGSMPMLYAPQSAQHGQPVRNGAHTLAAAYGRKNKVSKSHRGERKSNTLRLQPIHAHSNGLSQQSLFSRTSATSSYAAVTNSLYGGAAGHSRGVASASASDLTQALMDSLRTMQMHSNMVRRSCCIGVCCLAFRVVLFSSMGYLLEPLSAPHFLIVHSYASRFSALHHCLSPLNHVLISTHWDGLHRSRKASRPRRT
jgi:hypothetical protein